MCQLDAAATHIRMIAGDECDLRRAVDGRTSLRNHVSVDCYVSGQNQRARPLARRGKALLDDEDIEAFLGLRHEKLALCDASFCESTPNQRSQATRFLPASHRRESHGPGLRIPR